MDTALLSTVHKLKLARPSKWSSDEDMEKVGIISQFKQNIEAVAYILHDRTESVASMGHGSAVTYSSLGTDLLVQKGTPKESNWSDFLQKYDMHSSEVPVALNNVRKDAVHVTLTEAIRFFNTYENVGVDINKVSTSGNSRGFYRVEALKKIAKGLGLKLEAEDSKGSYVEAIQTFHTQNQDAIKRDKESTRLRVTLREELEVDP